MTLVLSSSNSSAYDKLTKLKSTADGEIRRLMEFRITRPLTITKQESDAVFGTLGDNYGLAGPVFIKHVLENKDAVVARLNTVSNQLDIDLALDQSDRYYSVVLSCIIVGGMIAKELNLHSIPMSPVYSYICESIKGVKEEVIAPASDNSFAANEALVTYINDNLGNALIINHLKKDNLPNSPLNIGGFRGPLKMRYEPDTKELWIPAAALRDYLIGRQVDVRQAVKDLAAKGIIKNSGVPMSKRLSAGALGNFEPGGVRCYCINGIKVGMDDAVATELTAHTPTP
jgi:hypothetical protein